MKGGGNEIYVGTLMGGSEFFKYKGGNFEKGGDGTLRGGGN